VGSLAKRPERAGRGKLNVCFPTTERNSGPMGNGQKPKKQPDDERRMKEEIIMSKDVKDVG